MAGAGEGGSYSLRKGGSKFFSLREAPIINIFGSLSLLHMFFLTHMRTVCN